MKKLICGLLCVVFIAGCAASSSTAAQQTKSAVSSESVTSSKSATPNYAEVKEAISRMDNRDEFAQPSLGITLWEYLAFVDKKMLNLNSKKLSEYPHAIYPSDSYKVTNVVFYLTKKIDIKFVVDQTNNEIDQIAFESFSGAADFQACAPLGDILRHTMKAFEPDKGNQLIGELHLYDANFNGGYEVKGDNYTYLSGSVGDMFFLYIQPE